MHFNILEWWWKWLKAQPPVIKTYRSGAHRLYEYRGTGLDGKKDNPFSGSYNDINSRYTWSTPDAIIKRSVQPLDKWKDLYVTETQTQYKRRHLLALAELL